MGNVCDIVRTDVLVIGAGAAGLRVAIELAAHQVPCLVIGKRAHGDAHTRWAAGGINAALGSLDADDTWLTHAADTLQEGHLVNDARAVELLARRSPDRVTELASWGCPFDRTEEGRINQRFFGAQTFRRTCFVGDRTGDAILATLVDRAARFQVPFRESLFAAQLLLDGGRVVGALCRDLKDGRYCAIGAKVTVLAAGGSSALYPRSSSRADENTGDSAALAFQAGADLRDMEFVQFHPTGRLDPPGRLVTEAVRGEGGRLFNAWGERFMHKYSPEHMELDARDVVARAIYREISEGRGTERGGVWLDVSHRDPRVIYERLPQVQKELLATGTDLTREPVEVAPTAHYTMGGIKVDFDTGATCVPGLFAVGEATSGVHGANRLGGNSLAETLVFGCITGAYLVERISSERAPGETELGEAASAAMSSLDNACADSPADVRRELAEIVDRHGSIIRSAEGLKVALRSLPTLRSRAEKCNLERVDLQLWQETMNLRFLLVNAEAILRAALSRNESRGAHFRSDHGEEALGERYSVVLRRAEDGSMALRREPLAPISAELRSALEQARGVDYHLLE